MQPWLRLLDDAGMGWRFGTDDPEGLFAAHGWEATVTQYGDAGDAGTDGTSKKWLWVGEDGVAADPAPTDRRLPVDLDPLERRPPVGAGEAPGHLPHPTGALHRLDPQPGRPHGTGIGDVALGGSDELVADHLPEAAELLI
jgi:hypothetical protein